MGYYADAYTALDCSKVAPDTHVDVASSGLVTGLEATIPLQPKASRDLIVVAIATDASPGFFGDVTVANSTKTLQIAMSTNPCGRSAYNFAFFDVEPATDSVRVSSHQPGTFVAFVARFSGLSFEADAHRGRYAWAKAAAGAEVPACPGTAIVTTTISCSDLALAPDSPFTLVESVQGMATAAYVPTAEGQYGASWITPAESSSMTIAFP